tara:strand:- start:8832 stop:9173 length:342 start_codon:yes stop_codon:yes gene_type:complete
MAKKKATAKKAASKKKTTAKRPAPKSTAPAKAGKPKDTDPSKLTEEQAKKRVAAIYRLQKTVESKAALHEVAKKAAASAKAALEDAQSNLSTEIHEQRVGPGPLFPPETQGQA